MNLGTETNLYQYSSGNYAYGKKLNAHNGNALLVLFLIMGKKYLLHIVLLIVEHIAHGNP